MSSPPSYVAFYVLLCLVLLMQLLLAAQIIYLYCTKYLEVLNIAARELQLLEQQVQDDAVGAGGSSSPIIVVGPQQPHGRRLNPNGNGAAAALPAGNSNGHGGASLESMYDHMRYLRTISGLTAHWNPKLLLVSTMSLSFCLCFAKILVAESRFLQGRDTDFGLWSVEFAGLFVFMFVGIFVTRPKEHESFFCLDLSPRWSRKLHALALVLYLVPPLITNLVWAVRVADSFAIKWCVCNGAMLLAFWVANKWLRRTCMSHIANSMSFRAHISEHKHRYIAVFAAEWTALGSVTAFYIYCEASRFVPYA